MSKKHVFVVGLDAFNRQKLKGLPRTGDIEFHQALSYQDIQSGRQLDMETLIEQASNVIRNSGVRADAIVSFYDFPATLLVPVLSERFGVRSPDLENVLKCEHKLWSRIEQQKTIPEHIPQFYAFDPFDDMSAGNIPLRFPYWIKPVKSFLSFLAYQISRREDLDQVLPEIRRRSVYLTEPFRHILELIRLPLPVADENKSFIAENLLTGRMCTAEGYVLDGKIEIYGIIDSIRESGRSSFARYEYPSSIPQEVKERMTEIARRVLRGIGLEHSAFNIEFFWNQARNQIWLLEINPRISESHADLFEKVHGTPNLSVMLDVALGREPVLPENSGEFRMACKFMFRAFEDGVVTNVPDRRLLRQIAADIPGTVIKPVVKTGDRLSDLPFQDSYSYLIASIFIGGRNRSEILDKYSHCLERLNFQIQPVEQPVGLM